MTLRFLTCIHSGGKINLYGLTGTIMYMGVKGNVGSFVIWTGDIRLTRPYEQNYS